MRRSHALRCPRVVTAAASPARARAQAEQDTAKRQAERVAAMTSASEEQARVASEAEEIRRELSARMTAWSDAAGKRKSGVSPNARARLRKLLVTLHEARGRRGSCVCARVRVGGWVGGIFCVPSACYNRLSENGCKTVRARVCMCVRACVHACVRGLTALPGRGEQVLGGDLTPPIVLPEDAAPGDAKKAYLKVVRLIHPDKMSSSPLRERLAAEAAFAVLSDAYEHAKA